MKHILSSLLFLSSIFVFGQVTITPNPFEVDQSITITVDTNDTGTNCNGLNSPTPNKVYLHSGIGTDSDPWDYSVVGNWGQDDGVGEMTSNGDGTWSITFIPETYYNLTPTQAQNAIKMGMVFRNEELQRIRTGCTDFYFDVGTFQVSLSNPAQNSTTILNSGDDLSISATNIGGNANYVLKSNGTVINSQTEISSYTFTHTNITENQVYSLEVSLNGTTIIKEFMALIDRIDYGDATTT